MLVLNPAPRAEDERVTGDTFQPAAEEAESSPSSLGQRGYGRFEITKSTGLEDQVRAQLQEAWAADRVLDESQTTLSGNRR